MCCSTCDKWEHCNKVDYITDELLRPCFRGKVVRLSTEIFDNFVKANPYNCIIANTLIMLKAIPCEDKRRFKLKVLYKKFQEGGVCICKVGYITCNYVSHKGVFSLFIQGYDFSITRSRFKELFGVDVDKDIVSAKCSPYFEPKKESLTSIAYAGSHREHHLPKGFSSRSSVI